MNNISDQSKNSQNIKHKQKKNSIPINLNSNPTPCQFSFKNKRNQIASNYLSNSKKIQITKNSNYSNIENKNDYWTLINNNPKFQNHSTNYNNILSQQRINYQKSKNSVNKHIKKNSSSSASSMIPNTSHQPQQTSKFNYKNSNLSKNKKNIGTTRNFIDNSKNRTKKVPMKRKFQNQFNNKKVISTSFSNNNILSAKPVSKENIDNKISAVATNPNRDNNFAKINNNSHHIRHNTANFCKKEINNILTQNQQQKVSKKKLLSPRLNSNAKNNEGKNSKSKNLTKKHNSGILINKLLKDNRKTKSKSNDKIDNNNNENNKYTKINNHKMLNKHQTQNYLIHHAKNSKSIADQIEYKYSNLLLKSKNNNNNKKIQVNKNNINNNKLSSAQPHYIKSIPTPLQKVQQNNNNNNNNLNKDLKLKLAAHRLQINKIMKKKIGIDINKKWSSKKSLNSNNDSSLYNHNNRDPEKLYINYNYDTNSDEENLPNLNNKYKDMLKKKIEIDNVSFNQKNKTEITYNNNIMINNSNNNILIDLNYISNTQNNCNGEKVKNNLEKIPKNFISNYLSNKQKIETKKNTNIHTHNNEIIHPKKSLKNQIIENNLFDEDNLNELPDDLDDKFDDLNAIINKIDFGIVFVGAESIFSLESKSYKKFLEKFDILFGGKIFKRYNSNIYSSCKPKKIMDKAVGSSNSKTNPSTSKKTIGCNLYNDLNLVQELNNNM